MQRSELNPIVPENAEVIYLISSAYGILEQGLAKIMYAILSGTRPPTCTFDGEEDFDDIKSSFAVMKSDAEFQAKIGCPSFVSFTLQEALVISHCMAGGDLERLKHNNGEEKNLKLTECYELIEKLMENANADERNWKILQVVAYIAFLYMEECLESNTPRLRLSNLYSGTQIDFSGHGAAGFDAFFIDEIDSSKFFTSETMVNRVKQAGLDDGMIFNLLLCHSGASFPIKSFDPEHLKAATLPSNGHFPLMDYFARALIKGGFKNGEVIGAPGPYVTYPRIDEVINSPQEKQGIKGLDGKFEEYQDRSAVSRTISLKEKILNSSDDELKGFGYTDEQIEKVHQMQREWALQEQEEQENQIENDFLR